MMQIVPEWQVEIVTTVGGHRFAISDTFASNVIRDVAKLKFPGEVVSVRVWRETAQPDNGLGSAPLTGVTSVSIGRL